MQLLVSIKVYREKFVEEQFCTTDDIFALVKSGSFSYETENESYIVSANEGALFKADVPGVKKVLSPVTMFLFRYKNEHSLFQHKKIVFEDTARMQSTLRMLDTLSDYTMPDAFDFWFSLFNDIVTQYRIENSQKELPNDEVILRAAKSLQAHYHEKLDLTEVAKRCNLSYPQFIRRFKKAMHVTPSDYVTALRFNKAKALLTDSKLQIREIAFACGFESEYYFSKFFKKHIGVSPAYFRKTTM